jgi:hypothetical protein
MDEPPPDAVPKNHTRDGRPGAWPDAAELIAIVDTPRIKMG